MLRKLMLALLLLIATSTANAAATDYTDVYYNPAESGWGFFLVQSNTFQFLAFFIYGADGKPTWYVALLTDNGTGTYTGPVGATTGSYFPAPWDPTVYTATTVGTATFQPIDAYHATFTYTINGAGTVMKTVQRQTLQPFVLAGGYTGSLTGSITGCMNPASDNPSFHHRFNLDVTQTGDQSAVLTFTLVDLTPNVACTLSGPLTHIGRVYQIANASYQCPISPAAQATIDAFHPTGQGIEGRWTADDGGGCTESIHFASVRR